MALPSPATSWLQSTDFPSRLFETGSDNYELYEEDGEFVLALELPGFDVGEIDVSWDEGVLNVAAESENEARRERRTYHRRFRFPKEIDDENIAARYNNGILEIRLPVLTGATAGTEIEIQT
ncbi:MAG: Hsp20/alpha crystallin family protein [Salinirussus sp.]